MSSAGIRGDSGFTIGSQFPDYILGGATATLLIAWVPATGGPASAEVTLVTDDPRLDQTIQVFGNSGGGNCGTDGDGDGYSTLEGDCDDTNPTVYPMAGEAYDGVDNDCDGQIDEGTYSGDDDGDGYSEVRADGGPGDCDDTNPWIWSGAPEDCDGVDNDCDGVVDEGEDGVAGSTCDALTEGL